MFLIFTRGYILGSVPNFKRGVRKSFIIPETNFLKMVPLSPININKANEKRTKHI